MKDRVVFFVLGAICTCMKNRLILIIFLLTLLPSSGFTQTSFRRMPVGRMSMGIGHQRYIPPKRLTTPFRFHAQTILGGLDYNFSRDLKMSLFPGVSFFDTNTQNPYEIAPSPSIDLRLLNISDLNMTGLEFFILGGFRTQYMECRSDGESPITFCVYDLQRRCWLFCIRLIRAMNGN